MDSLNSTDLDEILRNLRQERANIAKKEKVREEEYKKATKQYINVLKKEIEALEKNNPIYDKRNNAFREEVSGIQERFRVGAFNLIKTQERLKSEREKMNQYLIDTFPKLAMQVKDKLLKEKQDIDNRIQALKEENEKNKGNDDNQSEIPTSVDIVKSKRLQLEREIAEQRRGLSVGSAIPYEANTNYLSKFVDINRKSVYGHLDEYIPNQNFGDDINYPRKPFDLQRNSGLNFAKDMKTYTGINSLQLTASIPNAEPKTDLLSNYMYKIPPLGVYSQTFNSPSMQSLTNFQDNKHMKVLRIINLQNQANMKNIASDRIQSQIIAFIQKKIFFLENMPD